MTSASNTWAINMPTTSSTPSKASTKFQNTGREVCIVTLIWNRITSPARSILACLATSRHNSNGTNMTNLPAPSTPPTLWRWDDAARVHNIQSHTMTLQPRAPKASSVSNRLWVASYNTRNWPTRLLWRRSRRLVASRPNQPPIQWKVPSICWIV